MPKADPATFLASSRYMRWAAIVVLILVFWAAFPPFRIVSLDEAGRGARVGGEAEAFDPNAFVDAFWEGTLSAKMKDASDLEALARAVSLNPRNAQERFGQATPGYYFAQGKGEVVEVKGRRAVIGVGDQTVSLLIAPPVFGNTVRDGTGLLNVNDFPGLEQYNAVSSVLNQRVEMEVLPPLKDAVFTGATVSFVGCAKAPETVGDGPVLQFIPLRVEVIP